jgi:hypothetical protein
MLESGKQPAQNLAFSVAEASRRSGISVSLLYEEMASGRLISRKLGRRTVILERDFLSFLDALPASRHHAKFTIR